MNRRNSFSPALEVLEDRCCPSGSAWMSHGSLYVADPKSANIAISEIQPGKFRIADNGNVLNTFTVPNAVNVQLGGTNNSIVINLEGNAAPGDVNLHLPATTNNQVEIENGTIRGNLRIYGGGATDGITLGNPSGAALQVNQETYVQLNAGASDSLQVNPGVTLKGDLVATSANQLTLAAGSYVGGSADIAGGPAGNQVVLDGTVARLARFTGSMLKSDEVTVGASAKLGSLVVLFGDGKSSLEMNGTVLDSFFMQTGAGNDQIDLNGRIDGTAELDLGDGNNLVNFDGTIGSPASPSELTMKTGSGNNSVIWENAFVLNGDASVKLGAGNDVFTLNSQAKFQSALIDGGAGENTFIGNASEAALTLEHFQTIEQ